MGVLIKLLLPRIIDILVALFLAVLDDRVTDDKSKVNRQMVDDLMEEKDALQDYIVNKSRETGIYKKLKGM